MTLTSCIFLFSTLLIQPFHSTKNVHQFPEGLVLLEIDEVIISQSRIEFPLRLIEQLPTLVNNDNRPLCKNSKPHSEMFKTLMSDVHKMTQDRIKSVVRGQVTLEQAAESISNRIEYAQKGLQRKQLSTNEFQTRIRQATYGPGANRTDDFVADSSTDVSRGKRAVEHIKREKRSFDYLRKGYWTLSGYTEASFRQMRVWETNHFKETQNEIAADGIAIQKEGAEVQMIAEKLCQEEIEVAEEMFTIQYQIMLLEITRKTLDEMALFDNGKLPNTIEQDFIRDFCEVHFTQNRDSTICESEHLRDLFHTSLVGTQFDKAANSLIIQAKVSVPDAEKAHYRVFKVNTIPVFIPIANPTDPIQTKQVILNIEYYAALESSPNGKGAIGFIQGSCEKFEEIVVCSSKTYNDQIDCIESITTQNKNEIAKTCEIQISKSRTTCVAERYDHGIIVSTLEPLDIHRQNSRKTSIFNAAGEKKVGMFTLENSLEATFSVSCNGRLLSTMKPQTLEAIKKIDQTLTRVINESTWDSNFRDLEKNIKETNTIIKLTTGQRIGQYLSNTAKDFRGTAIAIHAILALLSAVAVYLLIKIHQLYKNGKLRNPIVTGRSQATVETIEITRPLTNNPV